MKKKKREKLRKTPSNEKIDKILRKLANGGQDHKIMSNFSGFQILLLNKEMNQLNYQDGRRKSEREREREKRKEIAQMQAINNAKGKAEKILENQKQNFQ